MPFLSVGATQATVVKKRYNDNCAEIIQAKTTDEFSGAGGKVSVQRYVKGPHCTVVASFASISSGPLRNVAVVIVKLQGTMTTALFLRKPMQNTRSCHCLLVVCVMTISPPVDGPNFRRWPKWLKKEQ